MLAVALFSICMAMAFGGFSNVLNSTVASVKHSVAHNNLCNSMSRMTRDLMESKAVFTYGVNNYFVIQKTNSAGTTFNVIYLIHNGTLYRFDFSNPQLTALGTGFDTLELQFFSMQNELTTDAASAVLVNLTVRSKTTSQGRVLTDAVETRVRLRNKQV